MKTKFTFLFLAFLFSVSAKAQSGKLDLFATIDKSLFVLDNWTGKGALKWNDTGWLRIAEDLYSDELAKKVINVTYKDTALVNKGIQLFKDKIKVKTNTIEHWGFFKQIITYQNYAVQDDNIFLFGHAVYVSKHSWRDYLSLNHKPFVVKCDKNFKIINYYSYISKEINGISINPIFIHQPISLLVDKDLKFTLPVYSEGDYEPTGAPDPFPNYNTFYAGYGDFVLNETRHSLLLDYNYTTESLPNPFNCHTIASNDGKQFVTETFPILFKFNNNTYSIHNNITRIQQIDEQENGYFIPNLTFSKLISFREMMDSLPREGSFVIPVLLQDYNYYYPLKVFGIKADDKTVTFFVYHFTLHQIEIIQVNKKFETINKKIIDLDKEIKPETIYKGKIFALNWKTRKTVLIDFDWP